MPLPFNSVTENDSAVATANSAETVIATTVAMSMPSPGLKVGLEFTGEITTGATTTAVVLKCRRGTTTAGAQVGATITVPCGAAVAVPLSAGWQDAPGEVVSQQYVVTAAQTGGTGAGSVTQSMLSLTVSAF